jgi:hypothetical protein
MTRATAAFQAVNDSEAEICASCSSVISLSTRKYLIALITYLKSSAVLLSNEATVVSEDYETLYASYVDWQTRTVGPVKQSLKIATVFHHCVFYQSPVRITNE